MSLTLEELYKIKKSLEELSADAETFNWGPTLEFANQRKAEALKLLRREIKAMKHESPYEIGKRLYKTGFGISDLWGAGGCKRFGTRLAGLVGPGLFLVWV